MCSDDSARLRDLTSRLGAVREWAYGMHGGTKRPVDVWPRLATVLTGFGPVDVNSGEHVVARLTIERFIDADGRDLVRVDSDNLNGGPVAVVEALGLLHLAAWDVCNSPAEETE